MADWSKIPPAQQAELRSLAHDSGFKRGWWIEQQTLREHLDWRALVVGIGAVAVGYVVGSWWMNRKPKKIQKPSSSTPQLVDGLL